MWNMCKQGCMKYDDLGRNELYAYDLLAVRIEEELSSAIVYGIGTHLVGFCAAKRESNVRLLIYP